MSNILACIDGSSAATPVCDYATWAASRLAAPLTLLHVLDRARFPTESDLSGNLGLDARDHLLSELANLDARRNRLALEQGRRMLDAASARVKGQGVEPPTLRQRHGHLVDTLAELESDIRLLVMGKQGEEHSGPMSVGDNVEKVIRTLHCPILLAHGTFREPRVVMLAFDNSEVTRDGVRMLADSPLFQGLTCHLVQVSRGASTLANELEDARQVLESGGHQVRTATLHGDIEPALHQYQREQSIDMVIMGAYGHSRLRELLIGSTTNSMIRRATVPHLLLR